MLQVKTIDHNETQISIIEKEIENMDKQSSKIFCYFKAVYDNAMSA